MDEGLIWRDCCAGVEIPATRQGIRLVAYSNKPTSRNGVLSTATVESGISYVTNLKQMVKIRVCLGT